MAESRANNFRYAVGLQRELDQERAAQKAKGERKASKPGFIVSAALAVYFSVPETVRVAAMKEVDFYHLDPSAARGNILDAIRRALAENRTAPDVDAAQQVESALGLARSAGGRTPRKNPRRVQGGSKPRR